MPASLLPLCLLLADLQTPQEPESAIEVVPLQHLCGQRGAVEPPLWGSMLRYPNHERQRDLLLASEITEPPFAPDQVVQMLQNLNQTEVDESRLGFTLQGDSMLVHGELAAVTRVQQQVDSASAALTRPLQIEVCVWDAADREMPVAVLGPREFAQFTTNLTPIWRRLAATHTGGAVALDRQRWTRYVYDVNPEVAQKQSISGPQTEAFCEGGRIVVRPHLLVGGDDLVLHVQFGLAQRRGVVRTVPSGMPGAPDIDVPLLETAFGVCSGRVVNGGALAVSLRGNAASGGQLALTVRVTARTPPATSTLSGIAMFPCGALVSQALTQQVALPSVPPSDEGQGLTDPSPGFGCLEPDHLVDLARSALGGEAAETVAIHAAGGYLFVRGDQQAQAAIESLLRSLQDRLLRNVTVRHTARLQATDSDPTGGTSPLLHDFVVPSLLGRSIAVARILETNVVRSLEAHIAQEASMLDPVVEQLQVGTWLRGRIAPLGSAQHLLLEVQSAQGPQPLVRSIMPAGGMLMPTEVASTRASHDGPVASAQVIEHGDGPSATIEGRVYRSALTTTLTW